MNSTVLNLGRGIYLLIILSIASYWDLKRREINPDLWYISIKTSLPFTIYSVYLSFKSPIEGFIRIAIILDVTVVLLYIILFLIGFIGGADVGAVVLTAIAMPYLDVEKFHMIPALPIVFIVAFIGSILQIIWNIGYVCTLNLKFPEGFKGIKCPLRLRVKARRLLRMRWWFLYSGKFLEEFSLEEWPHYRIAETIESKGEETPIEVVPGMPHILFYTIGYLMVFLASFFL